MYQAAKLIGDKRILLTPMEKQQVCGLAAWGHYLLGDLDAAKASIEPAGLSPEGLACRVYVWRDQSRREVPRPPRKERQKLKAHVERVSALRESIGSSLDGVHAFITLSQLVGEPDLVTLARIVRPFRGESATGAPTTKEDAGKLGVILLNAGTLILEHIRGGHDVELATSLLEMADEHFKSANDLRGQSTALLCAAHAYQQRGDTVHASALALQSMVISVGLLNAAGHPGPDFERLTDAMDFISPGYRTKS